MPRSRATLIGFAAVILWSMLAVLTVGTAPVPPLLLNAICFGIGGAVGIVWLMLSGEIGSLRQVPLKVYVIGTAGLFGYHFFYFSALRMAPAAEAGLIAATILLGGREGSVDGAMAGYALALVCAFTWSGYSIISRSFGAVPTGSVAVFCLATAVLSAVAHLQFETALWPAGALGWLSVIGLGLGPVGLAFYVWDIGVKKGDIQLLGVASYAAPVLSTLILVLAGVAAPSWSLLAAAVFRPRGGRFPL
ncbi:MAG: EamA family transporter [Rhodobacteraceae bacterium]|nr:EamA family transporter [Paracoccaceae bacterium]